MANLRGIINRVAGGAASGRRTGGTPGPGRVGGPGVGASGGRRSSDEAIGRGVRGLLSRFGGRR
ncbi:hypothetical protein [Nocardioides aurantiacus]|uniref:hypothetical protein n=1 Tax=Nocardioides aurantiacus TaxID=86796 RepID=UPI00403F2FD2